MRNYVNYRDNDDDTEERVQVTQAFCNTEEEIEEAIERSKRDLKTTSVPYGYQKLDEEIITTVYKIPDDEIIDEVHESKYNKKVYNSAYNENEYENYQKGDGRMQNFCENEISKDGQYLISMTLSKKVMDNKNTNRRENIYNNNIYREEIEVQENDGIQRDYEKCPFDNYQSRNQTKYGNEYYVNKEQIDRNKYFPIRSERKVTRFYNDDNYYDENYEDKKGNKEIKKYVNSQTQSQSINFPAKYKKGEFNYYDY